MFPQWRFLNEGQGRERKGREHIGWVNFLLLMSGLGHGSFFMAVAVDEV